MWITLSHGVMILPKKQRAGENMRNHRREKRSRSVPIVGHTRVIFMNFTFSGDCPLLCWWKISSSLASAKNTDRLTLWYYIHWHSSLLHIFSPFLWPYEQDCANFLALISYCNYLCFHNLLRSPCFKQHGRYLAYKEEWNIITAFRFIWTRVKSYPFYLLALRFGKIS